MATGKTGKYFKYAIGEIILVVIGILIALSINNWNEKRKYEAQEQLLLIDLKKDVLESKKEIEQTIGFNGSTIKHYRYILQNFESNLGVTKELQKALSYITNWSSPYLTYSAYETLKNKGLDLITNNNLKKDIIALYENDFTYLMDDYDHSEWVFSQGVSTPLTNKFIRANINNPLSAEPNNYNEVKTNDEFLNMMHRLIDLRQNGLKACNGINSKIDDLVNHIDTELKHD